MVGADGASIHTGHPQANFCFPIKPYSARIFRHRTQNCSEVADCAKETGLLKHGLGQEIRFDKSRQRGSALPRPGLGATRHTAPLAFVTR